MMNPNTTPTTPKKPTSKRKPGKPWQTVKGKHRDVPVYSWVSDNRRFYRVLIPGRVPPEKTSTNEAKILALAKQVADSPATVASTLADVPPALLTATATAVQKLQPVLVPLNLSVDAAIEEYAYVKSRLGKLGLRELVDSLLLLELSGKDSETKLAELRDIVSAVVKLRPVLAGSGISVVSGLEEFAAVKTLVGNQDLRRLFEKLGARTWIKKSQTQIVEVVEEFLRVREIEMSVRPEYHRGLYYSLGALVKAVGKSTAIGTVTTDDLKKFVFNPKRKPRSNKTYRTNVRAFFKWCQLNEYLDYGQPTAADRLEKIKCADPAPRILTVAEAKAILTNMEDIWSLLYVVISVFTGIRHDELQRLTFKQITPGEIVEVSAEMSKTRKRRLIPLQPVLNEWLRPFYGRQGFVMPVITIQNRVRLFLQNSDAADLPKDWARNWLRQTYCSYRLAQTGEVLKTAIEDGHHAYVLERVYLKLSSKEEANNFFALTPEACGHKDWNDRVAAFLADEPELLVRESKEPNWKGIGDEDKPTKPIDLPAQPDQKAA